jgi:hypothetical protein
MRRLAGVVVLALLAGCGGGGGAKPKKPDGGTDAKGSGAAGDLGSNGGAGGSGGVAGDAAGGAGGSAGDAAGASGSAGGAAGAAGGAGGTAGADAGAGARDAADATPDAVTDAAAEVEAAPPKLVTVAFSGQVETVAGTPLGFDGTVRLEAVSGSFTYDLRLVDELPTDPKRGKFWRGGTTAFTFTVKGHTVTGSGLSIVQTEDLNPDTFRFLDGNQNDTVTRIMKLDGADAPKVKLYFAVTDDTGAMLTSDALPDPFPAVDIANDGGFTITHTFSLSDDGGTMLMKLSTLVSQ